MPLVQLVSEQVPHGTVRVVDQDSGGPRIERAAHGDVDVLGSSSCPRLQSRPPGGTSSASTSPVTPSMSALMYTCTVAASARIRRRLVARRMVYGCVSFRGSRFTVVLYVGADTTCCSERGTPGFPGGQCC